MHILSSARSPTRHNIQDVLGVGWFRISSPGDHLIGANEQQPTLQQLRGRLAFIELYERNWNPQLFGQALPSVRLR